MIQNVVEDRLIDAIDRKDEILRRFEERRLCRIFGLLLEKSKPAEKPARCPRCGFTWCGCARTEKPLRRIIRTF